MQIDFHHGVTYVVARLAGFDEREAMIVAHSAQYVDDATESGEIWFDNGAIYARGYSAHKMLDYRNSKALANHRVWLPFHFLPGNAGESRPASPPALTHDQMIERSICRPNSAPAQALMRAVIRRQDRPYALHRLGVAAHVFADTWAHQGFVGYQHAVNLATQLDAEDQHHERGIFVRLKEFFREDWDETRQDIVGTVLPLGHGTVLSYPDRPYLKWAYTNGLGERIERDNPSDFLAAATELHQHFCRYLQYVDEKDAVFEKRYDTPRQFRRIGEMLANITSEDGDTRHEQWIGAIAGGEFGFRDDVQYVAKGEGSWKAIALGTVVDLGSSEGNPIAMTPEFARSDWKCFHDALQAHRFYVLNELLPQYGIYSA
ncbi:MAG: DUF6765 family protein [Burkholderiales bacterium]